MSMFADEPEQDAYAGSRTITFSITVSSHKSLEANILCCVSQKKMANAPHVLLTHTRFYEVSDKPGCIANIEALNFLKTNLFSLCPDSALASQTRNFDGPN